MAVVAISDSILTDIADAIRAKNGQETLYKPSEMPDAIEAIGGGGITPTGTINITENGTHDVTNYASANVAVPNSYSASDEGKVVSNGALVAQTSDAVTENDTYDTTLINSLTVNVSGGGGGSSFATGTFIPETNETSHEIDTGGTYDHLVMYTETSSAGNSARAFRIGKSDWSSGTENSFIVSTNNSGSSVALELDYSTGAFTRNGTKYTYIKSNAKLIAGISHRWVAW